MSGFGTACSAGISWPPARYAAATATGRHTTAWRELLPLPNGGVLLGTPGLRGVGLHDTDDGLEHTFAEITELARDCRFADCAHTTEPGCVVLAAVEDGRLN